jgi:hypothetical protein
MALLLRGSDLIEQNAHGILLVQSRRCYAPIMNGAAFAQGNHFLSHGANGFRLLQRRGDATVFDETANHISQHRIAMLAGSPEFGRSLKVTHTKS